MTVRRAITGLAAGLLLAGPALAAEPGCAPPDDVVLAALNALRARPQHCGSQLMPAAPALGWQLQLAESSLRYAHELAARDRIAHVGPAGESLQQRLAEVGYPLWRAGENLAGGQQTLDEVLAAWLASPAHCENLMTPVFEDAGLACVRGPGELRTYWVLNLGAVKRALRSSPDRSP